MIKEPTLSPRVYKIEHDLNEHHYWIELIGLTDVGPRWYILLRPGDIYSIITSPRDGYESADVALTAWKIYAHGKL